MTVCNRCGKENQDHYKFCLGCGAELTAPKPAAGGDMGMMKTMMADPGPGGRACRGPWAARRVRVRAAGMPARRPHGRPAVARCGPAMPPVGSARWRPDGRPVRSVVAPIGPRARWVAAAWVCPRWPRRRRCAAADGPAAGRSRLLRSRSAPARRAGGMRRCPSCGSDVPPTFRFCGTCGFRMDEQSAAQPMPMPPAPAPMGMHAPPQPQRARLSMTLIRPDGSEGGTHDLRPGENKLGRSFGPVFENDGYLSPVHAMLDIRGAAGGRPRSRLASTACS